MSHETKDAQVSTCASRAAHQNPLKVSTNFEANVAGSQVARIAEAFRRGEALTALSALHKYQTLRLAAVVHSLRRRGMGIAACLVPIPKGNGRVSYVARYWLSEQQ